MDCKYSLDAKWKNKDFLWKKYVDILKTGQDRARNVKVHYAHATIVIPTQYQF